MAHRCRPTEWSNSCRTVGRRRASCAALQFGDEVPKVGKALRKTYRNSASPPRIRDGSVPAVVPPAAQLFRPNRDLAAAAALFVVTFAVFSPALFHPLLGTFDDPLY